MVDFVARLDLPLFIPKEEILGKYVFDYDIVCIGIVKDWTYMSDGEVKMIVRRESKKYGSSTVDSYEEKVKRVKYLQNRGFAIDWILKSLSGLEMDTDGQENS